MGVDGAGIAIEHDIGDLEVADHRLERGRPALDRAFEGNVAAGVGPEGAVAAVEADAQHLGAGPGKHVAQTAEERSMRALQQQKTPIFTRDTHRCPFRPSWHILADVKGKFFTWLYH